VSRSQVPAQTPFATRSSAAALVVQRRLNESQVAGPGQEGRGIAVPQRVRAPASDAGGGEPVGQPALGVAHRDPAVAGQEHRAARAAGEEPSERGRDTGRQDRGGGAIVLRRSQGQLVVAEVDVGGVKRDRAAEADAGSEQDLDQHAVAFGLGTGSLSEPPL